MENDNLSNKENRASRSKNLSQKYLKLQKKCRYWRTSCFVLVIILIVETLMFLAVLIYNESNAGRTVNSLDTMPTGVITRDSAPAQTDTPAPASTSTPYKSQKSPSNQTSNKGSTMTISGSSSSSGSKAESYWCMGKNDTCQNKTNSAYDFYCSSCDRNNNNIEDCYE